MVLSPISMAPVSSQQLVNMTDVTRARRSVAWREMGAVGRSQVTQGLMDHGEDFCLVW